MRIFITVLSVLSFSISTAFADEFECITETNSTPSPVLVQAVTTKYPHLNETQRKLMASMFELAYNQDQLAGLKTTSEAEREFALRIHDIALEMAAIQIVAFDVVPQMVGVLERMQAEEAAGLKQVSPELEPDVRKVGSTMLVIGMKLSELSNKVTEVSIDRLLAIAESGNNNTEVMDAAERTMCAMQSSLDVIAGIASFLPDAGVLAYVRSLSY